MRLILFFALAMIAIYLVRRAFDKPGARPAATAGKADAAAERMVACAHCGLHIPESEAVRGGDETFCCAEHHRQHRDGGA